MLTYLSHLSLNLLIPNWIAFAVAFVAVSQRSLVLEHSVTAAPSFATPLMSALQDSFATL